MGGATEDPPGIAQRTPTNDGAASGSGTLEQTPAGGPTGGGEHQAPANENWTWEAAVTNHGRPGRY